MSQENVELVLSLMSGPDANVAQLVRDDLMWAALAGAVAPFIAPDFECVGTVFGTEKTYAGVDGFREFFLDWLAPWTSYRAEVEEAIDLDERVLVVYRLFGRHRGSTQEVKSTAAWVWTVLDGKIARIKGYADPAEALRAVGLAE